MKVLLIKSHVSGYSRKDGTKVSYYPLPKGACMAMAWIPCEALPNPGMLSL